jgi:hypothetical protein
MSEKKPNPGSLQIKSGKMRMYLNDAWQDFGIAYVVADMKRIAKPVKGRKSAYAPILMKIATTLDRGGLPAIRTAQEALKPFWGSSERWMAQDCRVWHGWLQQIWQFRNISGKKDVPVQAEANKAFRDNYDKTFSKAA